jgi:hypothetical protein
VTGVTEPPTPRRLGSLAWRTLLAAALTAVVMALAIRAHEAHNPARPGCVAAGSWLDPASGESLAADQLVASLAERPVVLLGEAHDDAEHHRWQLHTLAALHGRHPDMVLGFESFPRRVQPVLDRWVKGELDAGAFLEEVDWPEVWGYDAALYLPLFHFARQNRVPMIALNVERDFVSRVRDEGWSATRAGPRSRPGTGTGCPIPPRPARHTVSPWRRSTNSSSRMRQARRYRTIRTRRRRGTNRTRLRAKPMRPAKSPGINPISPLSSRRRISRASSRRS